MTANTYRVRVSRSGYLRVRPDRMSIDIVTDDAEATHFRRIDTANEFRLQAMRKWPGTKPEIIPA